MQLMALPSNTKLDRDKHIVQNMRFRRSSLLALNKTKDMRFIVKISMDKLGNGSVILPNLPILNEKVNFYAKTTELTTILTFNMQQLQALCKLFPDLRDAIRSYRQVLHSTQEENSCHFINFMSLDYEKHFPNAALLAEEILWNAKMVVRRSVFGKVLRQRAWRLKGTLEMKVLSRKLTTILHAELDGDAGLAEKIRLSAIPGCGRAELLALRLLTAEEAGKPLRAQLALQASRQLLATNNWSAHLTDVYESLSVVAAQRALLREELDMLRVMVQITIRLCGSFRKSSIDSMDFLSELE